MILSKSQISGLVVLISVALRGAPEAFVLDFMQQTSEVEPPAWIAETTTDGVFSEAGLTVTAANAITVRLIRSIAPTRFSLLPEGSGAQPLLLCGYAVSEAADGEETTTLCATETLSFGESALLDFSVEEWGDVSYLAILPQENVTVTALTVGWDTDDLPGASESGEAGSGTSEDASEQAPEVVWMEATSPSRECPVAGASTLLMPTDHVTLRASTFNPFSSQTANVTATVNGTTVTEAGALRFRNKEACVVLGQPEALDFAQEQPFAISAWIRPEKKDGLRNIVARGYINTATEKRELYLRFKNGNLQLGWWCNSGEVLAEAAYTPSLGTWAHLMGVFDGTAYILYVNGEEVARASANLKPVSFAADWSIGRHASKRERFFYGDVGEVSFYKGTVSPEAVSLLAQSRAQGLSEASIRGIWSVGNTLVVLTDTTPPALVAPDNQTLPAPQEDLSEETRGRATASDAASSPEKVSVISVDEGPSFITLEDGTSRYRLIRHWIAEDAAGLEAFADQMLDLSDTVPPVLTLPADCALTQRQGIAPAVAGSASATDNSGMEPEISWQDVADSAIGLGLRWSMTETLTLSASQPTGCIIGTGTLLDETLPYTLSVTIKPASELKTLRGDFTLISKEYLSGKEVIFRIENGAYQFGYNTGVNRLISFPMPEEDVDTWVTLTGVYDGVTLRLYREGTLVAEGRPAAAPIANAGRWAVGYNPAFTDRQFRGEIARATVWQRALSGREVAVLARGGAAAIAALPAGAESQPLAIGLVAYRPDLWSLPPIEERDTLGDKTLLDERKGFSLSASICPEAVLQTRMGQATIISKGYVNGKEVVFRVEDGNYQFGFVKGVNCVVSYPIPDEDLGQWVTLTGTLEGRQMRLYRNGVEVSQGIANRDLADYAADWSIGYSTTLPGREFQGEMRDVAIWSRPLSAQECAQVGTLSHEAFCALNTPAEIERERTIVRRWTATDPFGNAASGLQTLTISGAYTDPDADSLCDVLELEVHGTNPDLADTDGDTLPDGDEVMHFGTNPCLLDTDCDRLPDAWELQYGFNPRLAGETYLDPDGDGLANISEWQAGTNPLIADTDGDGLNDGLEVLSAHSDSLSADIEVSSPEQQGETVQGNAFVSATGTWGTAGALVYARERSGSLTYRLTVPSPAPQALAVMVEQHNELTTQSMFELSLKVDGLFVARFPISAPKGSPTEALFFLPMLEPGEHTFTLAWHNWKANSFVAIHSLRFLNFEGPDEDLNGTPDWQDHRNAHETTVAPLPEVSLVSPVCIEGTDLWRDVLEIHASYPEEDEAGEPIETLIPVVETIGEGFYVDVPLSASGEAVTLTLDDRSRMHSFPVAWAAFDVTAGLTEEAPFPLRKGDALRLFGGEGGQSVLTIQAATADDEWSSVANFVSAEPVVYTFEEAGLFRVVAEDAMTGNIKGVSTVEVTASRFPQEVIALWLGKVRTIDCPELAQHAILDYDMALNLSATPREAGGVTLALDAQLDRTHGMVSRLGEAGPVLDAAQVRPVWGDNGGYYRVLQRYADGSQLTEVVLQLGAVPPGLRVQLEIFVAGVSFEDGTRTKWLTAEDFDEYGICRLTFIRGANVKTSVCHRTYIYQDGVRLGVN